MAITIKKINHENLNQLQEISIETFTDTFKAKNSYENIKDYIDKAYKTEQLKAELYNPLSEFYFICFDDEAAGYLKLNAGDAQSEKMEDGDMEIERIYIRKKFQRKGLGEYLINKAIERANALNKNSVWLGVWEENHNALAFYKKMGFVHNGSHSFYMGEEKQTDLIMQRILV
jgi:ribosomal protein S18 acetylase RimI-like enzyme